MAALVELASLLESDPAHRGGRPYIAGTRVSVARIGVLYSDGMSPDEIAQDASLALPQVYAALAYYLSNRAAVDEDVRLQDAETLRIAAERKSQSLAGS
jgi:uncharacterized protein (DUF433 family)